MDRAGILNISNRFAWSAHRKVGVTTSAEVGRGKHRAEAVLFLGGTPNAIGLLAPELVTGSSQTAGRAIDEVSPARPRHNTNALFRDPDSEVIMLALPKIGRRERTAEAIPRLSPAADARALLTPQLIAARSESVGGAIKDIDCARTVAVGDPLAGNTYRQVGEAVAIKVSSRYRTPKTVARLGDAYDAGGILTP